MEGRKDGREWQEKGRGEERIREGKGREGYRTSKHSPSSKFATTLLGVSKMRRQ